MYLILAKNSPNGPQIIKTLWLVKHSVSYNQNVKNFQRAGKEDLKKTIPFLMACDENETRINQWKVDRLRLVLMESLLKLIHVNCDQCKDMHPVLLHPGEIPYVCCVRSNIMACPRCFTKDDLSKENISNVCKGCKDIVTKQAGIATIDNKVK